MMYKLTRLFRSMDSVICGRCKRQSDRLVKSEGLFKKFDEAECFDCNLRRAYQAHCDPRLEARWRLAKNRIGDLAPRTVAADVAIDEVVAAAERALWFATAAFRPEVRHGLYAQEFLHEDIEAFIDHVYSACEKLRAMESFAPSSNTET